MQIKVYHTGLAVASIQISHTNDIMAALEYAFFRTQNIEGSWSRGEFFELGQENGDYSADINVLAPLHEADGHIYGLRSSMVGDTFVVNDEMGYSVARMGFEEIV